MRILQVLLIGLSAVWPLLSCAQQAPLVTIADAGKAQSGSMRLVRKFTLATSRFTIYTDWVIAAKLADGSYAFVGVDRKSIGIFDRRGIFMHSLGRRGSGPGEYENAFRILRGADDSVRVFDNRLRRQTVYDVRMTGVVRTGSAPRFASAAYFHGMLIVSDLYEEQGRVGFPLHEVNASGELTRAFGKALDSYADKPSQVIRLLDVSASGRHLISAHGGRYEFEIWSEDRRVPVTYLRTVSWFPPQLEELWTRGGRISPRPGLTGVSMDGNGIVFAAAGVPSRPPAQPTKANTESGNSRAQVAEYGLAFDTVLEAIDLNTRRVIGRVRIPGLAAFIPGSTELWQARETPEGDVAVDVFEIVLRR